MTRSWGFDPLLSNPVSYFVGGLLSAEGGVEACDQCLSPFSFFSRQHDCPCCKRIVCVQCSRHHVHVDGKGPQLKVCDGCFIKEKEKEVREDPMRFNFTLCSFGFNIYSSENVLLVGRVKVLVKVASDRSIPHFETILHGQVFQNAQLRRSIQRGGSENGPR